MPQPAADQAAPMAALVVLATCWLSRRMSRNSVAEKPTIATSQTHHVAVAGSASTPRACSPSRRLAPANQLPPATRYGPACKGASRPASASERRKERSSWGVVAVCMGGFLGWRRYRSVEVLYKTKYSLSTGASPAAETRQRVAANWDDCRVTSSAAAVATSCTCCPIVRSITPAAAGGAAWASPRWVRIVSSVVCSGLP